MINDCNFYEDLYLKIVEVIEYKSDVKNNYACPPKIENI